MHTHLLICVAAHTQFSIVEISIIPGLAVCIVCFSVYSGMSDIQGHSTEESQNNIAPKTQQALINPDLFFKKR